MNKSKTVGNAKGPSSAPTAKTDWKDRLSSTDY
jgi:hypothetical protein